VAQAVQQALAILDRIEAEGGAVSMDTITDMATQASTTGGDFTLNLVWLLLFLCWIFGIVDAYRIGKKQDMEATHTSQT